VNDDDNEYFSRCHGFTSFQQEETCKGRSVRRRSSLHYFQV